MAQAPLAEHDATESIGGQDPRSTTRRKGGTKPSAPRTGRSQQSPPHDLRKNVFQPCDGGLPLRHILGDADLADVDPELEQFAVERGAPQRGLRCWSRGSIAGSRSTLRDALVGAATSSTNKFENQLGASARPSLVGQLPARRKRSGTSDISNRAPVCPSTRASVASASGAAAR